MSLLNDKFTKQVVHDALKTILEEMDNDGLSYSQKLKDLLEEVKPQKGGGATENPPKEIDGITHHYCRMFKDYMPENEMVFSLGKCKGISIIGQKFAYQLKKQAEELKMSSIPLFQKGDIAGGNEKMAEAKAIEESIENPQTFIDEKARLELEASLEVNTKTEEIL